MDKTYWFFEEDLGKAITTGLDGSVYMAGLHQ